MKIAVTGALGHIGSRLIRELPAAFQNCDIPMIDDLRTQRYCSLFDLPRTARYSFHELDVLKADLRKLLAGSDAVIHLAAITNAEASFSQKELVETTNYNATSKVAEACCDVGSPMIFVSSTSVYGKQSGIVDENCPEEELKPQSPYAETKLREERQLQALGRANNLRFAICRFGTIAGVSPGMRFHTAVNKFCWQAVTGQPLTVWRTALHQKRPYLSLGDAVKAFIHIVSNNLFNNAVYNVLTENLTVNSIIDCVMERAPAVEIEYVDAEIMNQLSYEVAAERFAKLGFQRKPSIRGDIHETIDLLRGVARPQR